MPPGLMKRNSSKRKASEGSDEQEFSEEQSLVAGRPSRKAALKSHRVWDTLKPGAAKHAEVEEELSGESPGPGTSAKRSRVATKRTSKGAQDDGDQSDKQEEKNIEKVEQEKQIDFSQQEPDRVIIQQRKIMPPKVLHSHPQPAMNKEQLALIEQEMEKHDQFDEPDDEFSDEEEEHDQRDRPTRFVLDDPNDEDFDISSRGRRGGFRGGDSFASRGRGRGVTSQLQQQQQPQQRSGMIPIFSTAYPRGTTIQRGRPRGRAMAGVGGGIMRGRINIRQPVNYFASPQSRQLTNGIYSLQSGGSASTGSVGSTEVPVSRPGQQPPVVRVLRPMGMSSNFQALRPSSMTMGSTQSQQLAETNFTVNRDLENYRGRVVAGTSVQEFNDIIDHMLAEYQRIVDDRSRLITSHREYVNHLKQTNQAAMEMKDNKIRQLELSVEQLQQKVMVGVKQEQLRLVKQGTVPGNDNQDCVNTTQQQIHQQDSDPPQIHRMEIVGSQDGDDEKPELQHMDEGGVYIGDSNNEGGQQQSYWPSPGQQQRIRILGISGNNNNSGDRGIPQLHPNAPYFDDEMDDDEEEFDDEEDTAEMDDELGAQVTI